MKPFRLAAAAAAAAVLIPLSLTACSGSGSSSSGAKALTIEDYYTATYDPNYKACAKDLGVKLTVNHVAGAGLIAKVLQQSSSRTLPDVLMLDNPDVQQIASSGALSPLSDYGLDANVFGIPHLLPLSTDSPKRMRSASTLCSPAGPI